jgi:hypothetical protein
MRLTFIITIDPVKGLELLNVLLHSLNLQTQKHFNVVFYNQTVLTEAEVFSRLQIRPAFDYRFYAVAREQFLGNFPLWDLYGLHCQLLAGDFVGDYFMALHMEEFFDVDYVEHVTQVLETAGMDILFGNLSRTSLAADRLASLLSTRSAAELDGYLHAHGLKQASHWVFQPFPAGLRRRLGTFRKNLRKSIDFEWRTRLRATASGYSKLPTYHEDLYFMRTGFAREYKWFLPGRRMYFEDIHLCDKPGVCELGIELAKLTAFPLYFNRGRIYHITHRKYYYQLQDAGFTDALLALQTDDLILQHLQTAVRMYRAGSATLEEALQHARHNAEGTGSQNLNYKYHMQVIEEARTAARGAARGVRAG